MKDRTGSIYGLIDPRYGIVRYVGQTVMSVEVRFRGHLTEMRLAKLPNYKTNWMRKLRGIGMQAAPVVLAHDVPVPFVTYLQHGQRWEPFFDFGALDSEERYFVAATREECSAFGIQCVNGTDGGEGGTKTLATRQKMSQANKGKRLGRKSWCTGLTKENNASVRRISEKLTGREVSEHQRELISKAATERMRDPERIEQFKAMMKDHRPAPIFGSVPWNKGLNKDSDPRVAEYGRKGSAKLRGRHFSPEVIERRRLKQIGQHRSEEARANMRAAQARLHDRKVAIATGAGNPMYHKHHSEDTLAKIRKAAQARSTTKLTDAIVLAIRKEVAEGATGCDVAIRYGISFQHVSDIVRRKVWRHVA